MSSDQAKLQLNDERMRNLEKEKKENAVKFSKEVNIRVNLFEIFETNVEIY